MELNSNDLDSVSSILRSLNANGFGYRVTGNLVIRKDNKEQSLIGVIECSGDKYVFRVMDE